MTLPDIRTSPQLYARIGGALYLVIIVAGIFGEAFVRNGLIVTGDAAATAHNIMSSEFLWRIGIAGDLFMHVCDVPLVLILYLLLKPVDRNLSLLYMIFVLVQSSVLVASKLSLLTPLFVLGDAAYLKAFNPEQLQALAYLAIRSDSYGFGVGLIFFGFALLALGYLIFKSGYLPKIIGILIQTAGVCYLINSFALILSPALAGTLFPYILIPCFVGESTLCLWLLIKGVDQPRWRERAVALAGS